MNSSELIRAVSGLDPKLHSALRDSLIARLKIEKIGSQCGQIVEIETLEDVNLLPFLTEAGDLVIPAKSPREYHWWNGGKSILEVLQELEADQSTINRYRNN